MITIIAFLGVLALLGLVVWSLCVAGRSEDDELDPAHLGLFLVADDEADGPR